MDKDYYGLTATSLLHNLLKLARIKIGHPVRSIYDLYDPVVHSIPMLASYLTGRQDVFLTVKQI
jgi:hypothetical protein